MRNKKTIYNIFSTLILQLINIICGFIVPKIIISSFGSSTNGLITSISQFLSYIVLLEVGVGPVIKYSLYKPISSKKEDEIKKILKSSEKFFRKISYIFIVYIIALLITFPLIVKTEFNVFFTDSLIIIIAISTFAEYFFGMTYKLYLQANQQNYISSIIHIITTLFNTVMVIICAKLNASIHLIKTFTAIIFLFRPLMQKLYVKKKYNLNIKETNANYNLQQKWDAIYHHIASIIHNNTDIVLLTIFSNTAEVSVYSIYILVMNGIKNLTQSLLSGIDDLFGNMLITENGEKIKNTFSIYEVIYEIVIVIAYTCTAILIVDFVKIYTKEITDINYIRPTFAFIIVLAEFIFAIRQPYYILIKSSGNYKQTRNGAWIEAGLNIIISVLLIKKLGMIGVAIGTLIAMCFRTIDIIIYVSKNIIKRKLKYSIKTIIISIFEISTILIICSNIKLITVTSYQAWFSKALLTGVISTSITLIISIVFYNKELKQIINIFKNKFKRKRKHEKSS